MAYNILSSSTEILLSQSSAPAKFEASISSLSSLSLPITGVVQDSTVPPVSPFERTGTIEKTNLFLNPGNVLTLKFSSSTNSGPAVKIYLSVAGLNDIYFYLSGSGWVSPNSLVVGDKVVALSSSLEEETIYTLYASATIYNAPFHGCWPVLTGSGTGFNTAFFNRIYSKIP